MIPTIIERIRKTYSRNYGKESSVYLNEGYINVIYPLWLSVSDHASLGVLSASGPFLNINVLCSLLKIPIHPDERIQERQCS